MKPKEYLQDLLYKMSIQFPGLVLSYCYDHLADESVIQILPTSAYDDLEYGQAESNLIFEYVSQFPLESIRFIPAGSDDCLPEIEFELKGIFSGSNPQPSLLGEVQALSIVKPLNFEYPNSFLTSENIWITSLELGPVQFFQTQLIAGENTFAQAA